MQLLLKLCTFRWMRDGRDQVSLILRPGDMAVYGHTRAAHHQVCPRTEEGRVGHLESELWRIMLARKARFYISPLSSG